MTMRWRAPRLSFGLAGAILAAVLAAARLGDRFLDPRLRITFFDVGQGDAALIRFPGGSAWLVDAGGGFADWDEGKRELVPELARLGILSLDTAVLSHPDQDHGYGFLGVLGVLRASELRVNESFLRDRKPKRLLRTLVALAAVRGASVRAVTSPSDERVGGVRVTSLPLGGGSTTNDRALVLRLEFAGCAVLLPGDIEAAAEHEWVLRDGAPVTLLKVAHHGSRTSSTPEFLAAARPRWAVVSVGLGNRYGHPSSGVLSRLTRARAQVLRTDFHGYVSFTIAPEGTVTCETAQGSCGTARCR